MQTDGYKFKEKRKQAGLDVNWEGSNDKQEYSAASRDGEGRDSGKQQDVPGCSCQNSIFWTLDAQ